MNDDTAPTLAAPPRSAATRIRAVMHTPIGQLVRGRVGPAAARPRNWKAVVRVAALPGPAAAVVTDTLRRTRLWRRERIDVAQELVAHFADALDAGRSPEEAATAFGDPRTAAKLITRAKRRQRGPIWKTARATGWLLLAATLASALLAVRFFAGAPAPQVDYVAVLNERLAGVPEEDRAWPLYREGLLRLRAAEWGPIRPGFESLTDGAPVSGRIRAVFSANQDALALLRAAGTRAHMGVPADTWWRPEDLALEGWARNRMGELLNRQPPANRLQALTRDSLQHLIWPYTNHAAEIQFALAADAAIAAEAGDTDRAIADFEATLGFARQLCDGPMTDPVHQGMTAYRRAFRHIGLTLRANPQAFEDAELVRLAHVVAAADPRFDLTGDRLLVADLLQRVYAVGGLGGGRMTDEGMQVIGRLFGGGSQWDRNLYAYDAIAAAAKAQVVASRREVADEADRLITLAESEIHEPLYRLARMRADVEAHCMREHDRLRLLPLHRAIYWDYDDLRDSRLRRLAERDGLLVGIALELYCREHGSWPTRLEHLAPRHIPAVPTDPVTGGPIGYRLTDAGPLVYSLGGDGDDDAGRPPEHGASHAFTRLTPHDGDVPLWPMPTPRWP